MHQLCQCPSQVNQTLLYFLLASERRSYHCSLNRCLSSCQSSTQPPAPLQSKQTYRNLGDRTRPLPCNNHQHRRHCYSHHEYCNHHGRGSLHRCEGQASPQPCRRGWSVHRTCACQQPIFTHLERMYMYSWLFMAFIAESASCSVAKRTKPNPRLRWVSRSLTMICCKC